MRDFLAENRETKIPPFEKTLGEASPETQEKFRNELPEIFRAHDLRLEDEKKYNPLFRYEEEHREEDPHLLSVQREKCTQYAYREATDGGRGHPGKDFEEIERVYYEPDPEFVFYDSASISLRRYSNREPYNPSFLDKRKEGKVPTRECINFDPNIWHHREGHMLFGREGENGYNLEYEGNVLTDISFTFVDEISLEALREAKFALIPVHDLDDPGLTEYNLRYNEEDQSVDMIIVRNGKVNRVLNIPISVDVQQVKATLTEGLNLEDPYSNDSAADRDWLSADWEKVIGIKDNTIKYLREHNQFPVK